MGFRAVCWRRLWHRRQLGTFKSNVCIASLYRLYGGEGDCGTWTGHLCLRVRVWPSPFPTACAEGERILGMCRCPSPPTLKNCKALARIEPLQVVTMTLSVYYVPESMIQIIISTQGEHIVYKELRSQTMLFEVWKGLPEGNCWCLQH